LGLIDIKIVDRMSSSISAGAVLPSEARLSNGSWITSSSGGRESGVYGGKAIASGGKEGEL